MDKCRFAIWLWVVFSLTGLGQAWWDGRSDSTGGRLAILPQINQAFGQIRGQVTLQGRSYHDSVSIWLDETRFTGTGADGIFGFSQVVPGVHQLRAERGGFLCSQVTVTVGSGQLLTLNATLLRAGDANRDGRVNLLDLVLVGGYFRGQPPANPWADVNGDGIVDLLDLILVGGNYGLACPMPWTVLIETPTATPLPATRTPTVTSTPLATATSSATPTPRPVTMTPTVMRTPLATATSSATPTPRPVTMTPTVTQTPQPPATFTPISTPIPGDNVQCQQQDLVEICAWVSNGSPPQTGALTVYGRLRINGAAQTGQAMESSWHFQNRISACSAVTGSDGISSCRRIFVNEPAGFQVNIDVVIGGYTVNTWFTPK